MSVDQRTDLRGAVARLLNPRSIAIVGTSPTGGRGHNVHRYLQQFGYPGRIFGVNPKYDQVLGSPCYPSLETLPERVDCVIIALPAEAAVGIVEQAAQLEIGGAVVFASGFAEMGGEGRPRQERLARIAREAGLAICGPNCVGFLNLAGSTVAFSGSIGSTIRPGSAALVSQSGGLALELVSCLMERQVGLAYVVSSGNEAATSVEEYLDYLVDRPEVKLLTAVVEGFRNPRLFLDVAHRAAEREKPLIVMKLGRSEHGRQAASSHTGALAGDDRITDAVFRRWGITRTRSVDETIETIVLFDHHRWPTTERVAFVSGSGGRSTLMADLAGDAGLRLADYAPPTRQELRQLLPSFAAVNNPLDLTGAMYEREGLYPTALSMLGRDPEVGLLAVYQGARAAGTGVSEDRSSRAAGLAEVIATAARDATMPVVAFTTIATGALDQGVIETLEAADVPLLQGPESAVRAMQHAVRYAAFRRQARLEPDRSRAGEVSPPEELLARLRVQGLLSEHASKQLLQWYGIPTTPEVLARTAEQAERAAEEIGYPLVLKACSPRLPHKTEAGLVVLGIRDREELRAQFAALWRRAEAQLGPAADRLEGLLVQEQVAGGTEVIVGARASEFGPVVMFGAGGILAELHQDTSLRLGPVSEREACEMIAETRVGRLLTGLRGQAAGDLAAVARVIAATSRLADDLSATIAELDLNPLIVTPAGAVVVDALVRARSAEAGAERLTDLESPVRLGTER